MKNRLSLTLLMFVAHLAVAQTEFSQENATQLLKKLCIEIGPRPMGSPAERMALDFAVGKFREYGCDTAYVMRMSHTDRVNTNSGIAVGIRHGATDRMIVVGGHIDSAGPEIPGADDDGSGAATVMELARVLCGRRLQSTMIFCCWGGEEQGLEGSKYFVNHFDRLDSVVLMLQIDMANGQGLIDLDPDTHGASAPRWLVSAAAEEFSNLGYEHLRYPTHFFSFNYARASGSGSDHESFLQKGIPAIDFSTDVSNPIHTPRDNFDNFDPAGLKRSGDVMLKLVERFDHGVPSRETDRYWLYLIGATPVFVPIPVLWLFNIVAVGLSIIAFIAVRRRREPPDSPDRVKWSGVKMLLFSAMIAICGWFGSDILGAIKGVRYPWMTSIPLYFVLAFFSLCIGGWFAVRLSKILRLSRCPYVFYKRAIIGLWAFLILLGLLNIKLTVEPAAAILLISLALLLRSPILKFVLALFAPVWMLRLVFSEWSSLIFRLAAFSMPSDMSTWILFNGGAILFFSIYLLPFLFTAAAVVRDSGSLQAIIPRLRSPRAGMVPAIGYALMAAILLSQPVYDRFWFKNAGVEESYDMDKSTKDVVIRSGEYLSGLHIRHGGVDTIIDARTTIARIAPRGGFDTSWLTVGRQDVRQQIGDTTIHDIELTLSMTRRPFTVAVYYVGGKDKLASFNTPWTFASDEGIRKISWYSFPDSSLKIPVKLRTVGSDSIKERIEVTFAGLAYPMDVQREMTYMIPRTRYTQGFVYK